MDGEMGGQTVGWTDGRTDRRAQGGGEEFENAYLNILWGTSNQRLAKDAVGILPEDFCLGTV